MSSSLNIDIGQFDSKTCGSDSPDSTFGSRTRLVNRIFAIAVVLVAITSIYDAYLVFHFRASIDEQNPFCKWLISLEPKYVSVFLVSKGLGTLGVVSILVGLFKYWRRIAVPVAVSLVFFQAGLMSYLHGTDGRRKSVREYAMLPTNAEQPISKRSEKRAKKKPRDASSFTQRRRRRARALRLSQERKKLDSSHVGDSIGEHKRSKKNRLQKPLVNVREQ